MQHIYYLAHIYDTMPSFVQVCHLRLSHTFQFLLSHIRRRIIHYTHAQNGNVVMTEIFVTDSLEIRVYCFVLSPEF